MTEFQQVNECIDEISKLLVDAAEQEKNSILYILPYFYNSWVIYRLIDILEETGYSVELATDSFPSIFMEIKWK